MPTSSSPSHASRMFSDRSVARCVHHENSHSHVRNTQLDRLSRSSAFQWVRSAANSCGSVTTSTLSSSFDRLGRVNGIGNIGHPEVEARHLSGHVVEVGGGEV